MFRTILIYCAVIFFAIFLFFGASFVVPRNQFTQGIIDTARLPGSLFKALVNRVQVFSNLSALERENQNLRAQLADFERGIRPLLPGEHAYERAQVYSTYPYNNRAELTINAGLNRGLKEKMVVTVGGNILLGTITKVFSDYSIVRTIFSPDWQLAVKIGKDNVDALLVGGREPRLTLIVRGKNVATGYDVYASGVEVPFGIGIGTIDTISKGETNAFDEATIALPYDLGSVGEVRVLL